ncbi:MULTISPECIES: hypothetical protein [Sporosarcina]|uniref:hypothetical protein n=1 Tax=Sporosarcina TaxID=1569 RepID=UPI001E28A683|nr:MULTISPECIES: hypothetical protein [Sporosarcina]GKV66258.1 hypothetical protein NCCP2331_24110 [Sporosarcina sp. NCCP-2331]GLB56295.1 hypothetical protein NCCP2378_20820 [Sporosarcina sp. NCCP-2378]
MFKKLSPNIKSSITRSISQSFEQYMSDIGWAEEKYDIEQFYASWREYITTKALWYEKIPEEIKADPKFHQDLAKRVEEVLVRILNDPPSEEQIAQIEILQEKLDTHYEYGCKAEALYVQNVLEAKAQQQKK